MDYLREQVLTARNIMGHPVVDFLYGVLNYQIKHRLFPSMARNKLSEAHLIVAKFCAEHRSTTPSSGRSRELPHRCVSCTPSPRPCAERAT